MPAEDHAAVIRSLFDAFNEGDVGRCATLVTADFELRDMPTGQTFHGPSGLQQWLQVFLTAGPDAKTSILTTIVEGDWAATEHVGRSTHTGPLLTPPGRFRQQAGTSSCRLQRSTSSRTGRFPCCAPTTISRP
ncbi:ester cyclase [Arthrobacter sp. E918]|uniref:Ester cyclase n=1 Tax=Arthrobacter mobilis TaxID=2724944 RepID=A0A7X6K6U3_9MICC|nr:ester cyclase [Arthrobacter mobilis]